MRKGARPTASLVAVLAFIVAGCGGGDEDANVPPRSTASVTSTRATAAGSVRVGLVMSSDGRDAHSLDRIASAGLRRAETKLGVGIEVVASRGGGEYVPNLSELAAEGYDLVVAVGSAMSDAVATVATRFPDARFAIVDVPHAELEGAPANVRGLVFETQESAYLAGYLAGLLEQQESGSNATISAVGGRKVPRVDRSIAGYEAGAKDANARIRMLHGYSDDFTDEARCKEVALAQIAQGADIVFGVAGKCGLGALIAAAETNLWGIGIDTDQAYLGEHILTSAVKNVDVAVFETVQAVRDGSFTGGEDIVYDVASGGVGLGRISPEVPAAIVSKVQAVQADLATGRIGGIPVTVK